VGWKEARSHLHPRIYVRLLQGLLLALAFSHLSCRSSSVRLLRPSAGAGAQAFRRPGRRGWQGLARTWSAAKGGRASFGIGAGAESYPARRSV